MTPDDIRDAVLGAIRRVAPEADPASLEPDVPLREQLDIDAMDFLRFVIELKTSLGVDIPEEDYPQLVTVESCVDYLTAATGSLSENVDPGVKKVERDAR